MEEEKKKAGRKKKYTEERKQINIRVPLTKYNELSKLAEKSNKTIPDLLDVVIDFGLKVYNMKN